MSRNGLFRRFAQSLKSTRCDLKTAEKLDRRSILRDSTTKRNASNRTPYSRPGSKRSSKYDTNASPNPAEQYPYRTIFAAGFRTLWAKLRRYEPLAQFAIVVFLFLHYIMSIHVVAGPSMLTTIEAFGDQALVCFLYSRGRGIKRGDLISYESPIHRGERGIKRVLALEGDYVLRDTPGGLHGDLEDVEGWAWEDGEKRQSSASDQKMIQVPKGHCWIVGDNLSWSRDSRMFGPLPLALIRSKVLAIKKPGSLWKGWVDTR